MKLTSIRTFVVPKVNTVTQLDYVSREIFSAFQSSPALVDESSGPLQLVASIESAKSLWNLDKICNWKSEYGDMLGGKLGALLVCFSTVSCHSLASLLVSLRPKIASLFFLLLSTSVYFSLDCADTAIIRTPSRRELLYPRCQMATAAKAFGLKSIDMVCVNYKDMDYLKEECEDGRKLGFDGKVGHLSTLLPSATYCKHFHSKLYILLRWILSNRHSCRQRKVVVRYIRRSCVILTDYIRNRACRSHFIRYGESLWF
jgi:citrate lyase subunit beta-like protein